MTAPAPAGGPRRPRWVLFQSAAAAVFILGCVYVVVSLLSLRSTVVAQASGAQAQSTAIAKLSTALDQTRSQLQEHGVTPSAPPATSIVQGVPGVPGQSIVGPQGPVGLSPDPAVVASLAAGLVHPSPGSSGPPGAPGKDSTIPGPAGQDGRDGKDGAPGATGPAPSGWTFTGPDSTVYDCSPDSAGSTHYSCTAESGTGPQPSPTPTPTPSATAASNANYSKRSAVIVATGPGRP